METKYKVTLTVDERKTLLKLISEETIKKLIRARILLKQIAEKKVSTGKMEKLQKHSMFMNRRQKSSKIIRRGGL